jgi:hypothetical protein
MANPWFRLYSEFSDDPKVQMMSEALQRRLVMLFCSRCKDETLHETERAFHWRISDEELTKTKAAFIEKGFIDEDWNLLNWNRRQFLSDSSTDRVRRFRQTKKQDETLHETVIPVTVTAPEQNRTETEQIQNRPEDTPGNQSPDSVDTRCLSESVGIFGMKEQAGMNRLLAVHMKETGRNVETAIEHMIARWVEYQQASPLLEWSYGSSYKFFMSGNWDKPELWPRIGAKPTAKEIAWKKFEERTRDADETE